MAEEYRPDEDTIRNDKALDEYLDQLTQKIKAERIVRKKDRSQLSSSQKKLNADRHQNVIVTADSNEYVSLHKEGVYSDPREITGRAKDVEKSTTYNEAARIREKQRHLRSERRKKAKAKFRR